MAEQQRDEFKNKFNHEFAKLVATKCSNSFYMSSSQYADYLDCVQNSKQATSLTKLQRRRLDRFAIFSVGGIEKLIVPVAEGETNIRFFVVNEEMFDILHEVHLSIGHGGKHRMMNELNKKYKNVTQEVVLLFLKLCVPCQKKQKSTKKGLVVKPMVFSEMNSRCQVDLIDMQSNADGPYRFIMVYQDHLTKFVQLRPLQSKTAEEVAKHVLDIFCIFGAPVILQSDNGREFVNQVIENLRAMWNGLEIVHGKPRHSQSQGSVERANQDIQNMLMTWMTNEKCERWSEGLRFVQFMKNRAYHDGIKRSPYEAMFGSDAKLGLSTTSLPKEVSYNIRTEAELCDVMEIRKERRDEHCTGRVVQNGDGCGEENCREEEKRNERGEQEDQDKIDEQAEQDDYDEREKRDADAHEQTCKICNENCTVIGDICAICTNVNNIKKHRSDAKEKLESQAKKMKARSNSKFPLCKIGDTVRVAIVTKVPSDFSHTG